MPAVYTLSVATADAEEEVQLIKTPSISEFVEVLDALLTNARSNVTYIVSVAPAEESPGPC